MQNVRASCEAGSRVKHKFQCCVMILCWFMCYTAVDWVGQNIFCDGFRYVNKNLSTSQAVRFCPHWTSLFHLKSQNEPNKSSPEIMLLHVLMTVFKSLRLENLIPDLQLRATPFLGHKYVITTYIQQRALKYKPWLNAQHPSTKREDWKKQTSRNERMIQWIHKRSDKIIHMISMCITSQTHTNWKFIIFIIFW